MPPPTLIILVNWNGWRDSIACIRSCLALHCTNEGPPVRIMLCDNDSKDGSVEEILGWANGTRPAPETHSPVPLPPDQRPNGIALLDRAAAEAGDDGNGAQLLIVRTGGNLGFAGGNNVGLRWAMARGCGHAWLLNNDTVVAPDTLSALLRAVEDAPGACIAGSVLIDFERPDRIQALAGALDRRTFKGRHLGTGLPAGEAPRLAPAEMLRSGEFLYPVGASMLVNRAFLDTIDLMNEEYFLYYEEADWILRATAKGVRPTIATDSLVYHHMGASTGFTQSSMSASAAGYFYRSRLRLALRFAPMRLPFVLARMLLDGVHALRHGDRARAMGILKALGGRVRPPRPSNHKD